MRKTIPFLLLILPLITLAQELRLAKGGITDNLIVNDSLKETMAVYLPSNFKTSASWPVLFVLDMDGKAKDALSDFKIAAENEGYILASSNNLRDTLKLSQNILVANRMFNAVTDILPIERGRTYLAGFNGGARFATVVPTFVNKITGVISYGASIGNLEVLNSKKPFHYIGIVDREDFNYTESIDVQKALDRLRFPNQLIVFDGEGNNSTTKNLTTALRIFTLSAMAKGIVAKDETFIDSSYNEFLTEANSLFTKKKPLLSNYLLSNMIRAYNPLRNIDSIKTTQKSLKRSKSFRENNRAKNNYFLKESFTKDDYDYYLEEDVLTYNYNNLGWWNYQMTELEKIEKSNNPFEQRMGKRLRSYLNALIEDTIDLISAEKTVDVEALNFLHQLKTITEPLNYDYYLKIISNSSKIEDFGTALFYLEELLKKGYKDMEELYALDHTALFRITPEFNEVVEKYLKEARYELNEE
ncbi:alpha/beta hydrolase [Maribacter sp. 2210JD10-5]|uniref:alpha/beta hydrolase n=1 Tax=Maribacter sp. 2210JD10-5 TaxID=3386272 RepID=UPI0039BCE207